LHGRQAGDVVEEHGQGRGQDAGAAGRLGRIQGNWEGSEFKAAQVTRLRDGETIVLRDEIGHPAWAGGGSATAVGGAEASHWLEI
jgi:hypothetical protein